MSDGAVQQRPGPFRAFGDAIGRSLTRVRRYYFPLGDQEKTDRLVRRLVLVDILFLIYLGSAASDPKVVLTAILAGNGVGAIGGLLFAVPKQTPTDPNAQAGQAVNRPNMSANTSLEEVSDWLTKTIIGAGLVSWRQILEQLDISGSIVGKAISNADPDIALAGGVAVIVASSAMGALIGYLWFARHWPAQLGIAQKTWNDIFASSGQKQNPEPVAPAEPNLSPPPPPAAPPPEAGGMPAPPAPEGPPVGGAGLVEGEPVAEEAAAAPIDPALQLREAARIKYALMRTAPLFSHDWAKGMFGGSSSVSSEKFGKRSLTASVRTLETDWFEISLEVKAEPHSQTEAIFFLHNTFAQPTPTVGFDSDGVARLIVTAYGAFTVGVLLDDGSVELELDLAELAGAPAAFVSR